MVEIIISFLVMFAVFTLIVSNYKNYSKPRGFDYHNDLVIIYTNPWQNISTDSADYYFENLKLRLASNPGIESLSFFADNFPYSLGTRRIGINYQNTKTSADLYTVDYNFNEVFKIKNVKGRWFTKEDLQANTKPVVISKSLEKELFNDGNSIGKIIKNNNDDLKIIGVVPDLKEQGDFQAIGNKIFFQSDSSSFHAKDQIMFLTVRQGVPPDFEANLFRNLNNYLGNADIRINHFSDLRIKINNLKMVPVIVLIIITGFLIFSVALGLFGVLWLNINKRKPEIALRMANGASSSDILKQIVWEAIVLTTFSLLIGSFFALQFPLLNIFNLSTGTYLISFVLTLLFIYLVIIICALYPAMQAAKVYPAVTLHEE